MSINESQLAQKQVADADLAQGANLADLVDEQKGRFHVPEWLRIVWQNRKARVGLVMLGLFILVGIFAPIIAPYEPRAIDFMPGSKPSSDHWLGTTQSGEDIYSQLIYGTRTSLIMGLFGGILSTTIGLVIGMIAGYMGGAVDEVLTFFINLALVVPTLPLMIVIASYVDRPGLITVIIVFGVTSWAWNAILKRSQILTLKERDYITAAKFAGDGMWRIVFREIMPNMMSLVIYGFIGTAAGAIGAEAGLSFLGIGDPMTVSWGSMMNAANSSAALLTGAWWWIFPPGLAVALLMTSLALINFGVDAISNPHLREE